MSGNKLQTLDRGLSALFLIAQSEHGLKVAELAEKLELNRAIAYRLIATLSDHHMVQRLANGRIVLGSGVFLLEAHAESNLRALARPILEALAEQTKATAFLSMAQGEDCVALLIAEPRNAFINIQYRVGSRHPLDKGAVGIAILSGRPAQAGDSQAVLAARRDGYSVTCGELQQGAIGAASPVRMPTKGFTGIELAIGIVALQNLEIEVIATAIKQAAQALSTQLGGQD